MAAKTELTSPLCRNTGVSRSRKVHLGSASSSFTFRLALFIPRSLVLNVRGLISQRRCAQRNADAVGNVLTDFRDGFLRDKNQIARADLHVLSHILSVQKILQLEFSRLHPAIRGAVIKKNLRLRGWHETTGDRDRLRRRQVISQVILSRLRYLPGYDEIRSLKIL